MTDPTQAQFKPFLDWFKAPEIAGDDVQNRRVTVLNLMILLTLLGATVLLPVSWLDTAIPPIVGALTTLWWLALVLGKWLLHRGHVRAVSVGLSLIYFVCITSAAIAVGGVRAPMVSFYVMWVTVFGLLFQWRGLVLVVVASSGAVLGLVLAQNAGLLPGASATVGLTQWVVLTIAIAVTAVVSHFNRLMQQREIERTNIELVQRKRSAGLLRSVINSMLNPVCIKDAQGRFSLVNQALAKLYNTSELLMLDKPESQFGMTPHMAQSVLACIHLTLSTGKPQVLMEQRKDASTGQIRHYQTSFTALDVASDSPQVLVVAHDVTELEQEHLKVAESEKMLQAVQNITQAAVWDLDVPTGRVVFNQQWNKLLGFQKGEVTGTLQDVYALVHPKDRHAMQQRMVALLCGETPSYQSEHRLLGRYGALWVQDRGGVFERDAAGRPLRVIGSLVDISSRRAALDQFEALLHEQQTILDSNVVGLVIMKDRKIQWVNSMLTRCLGYDVKEALDHDSKAVFGSEEAYTAFGQQAYPEIARGKVYKANVQLFHKDGTAMWFAVSGAQFGRRADQVIWSFINITEFKQTQIELERTQQQALAATLAKSQFLATMSHELRTPMNGILGMAQMLEKPQVSDDQRLHYAQTILSSGRTLLMLLNDILDLSKVEAGKLRLESTAFAAQEVVNDIKDLFFESAQAKGLTLTARWHGALGGRYLGDPARLRQMVTNLVNNALKFTEHGAVQVSAMQLQCQDGQALLEFSVQDTGLGIEPEQQQRLFQAFSQAEGTSAQHLGGSGLGLSIVRSLAEMMGGTVGLESTPGQGSRFWFRVSLPTAPDTLVALPDEARPAPAALPPEQVSEARHLKILVAEDNVVNRTVIKAMLGSMQGFEMVLTFAENGQQALAAITQGNLPDVVLMDVQMPVMDGLTATVQIRQWEAEQGQRHLPIIALTANAYDEDRERCRSAGMDGFLAKPLDVRKLEEVLRGLSIRS
ncbi:PAS domain-containing hybrid sensor histidine kinase/response regulator [Rhodoferax sp.]|uniref:PAS domain-containing hybrid sensor histidine kinase/response regulator n=1 Tax=Rhodoferax sp. TaxID=50421 RepID=UPI00261FEA98|nr:PAS domain-containing hybrid sensor histidine kinase/response regulator [Rhodoferax sp.]MDD2808624.1 ATP-binding protein [Rhodoferax sp.]MDD4942111.1 ATP-binding protein [Rhodoferax sp.]